MKVKTLFQRMALGAGAAILLAGLAIAQTAPATQPPAAGTQQAAPAQTTTPPAKAEGMGDRREARHKLRQECRDKARDMKGADRREAMHKCMAEGRAAGGMENRHDRKAKHKEIRDACRAELKDQRFTEDERRKAMQDCAVKKDPSLAKGFACRDEAQTKKLERGSREFRSFMRECHTRP